MQSQQAELWLPTPQAAQALGISQATLRRARQSHGGVLRPGVHYIRGLSLNSKITWNIDRCRQTIHRAGEQAYAAYLAMRELQKEAQQDRGDLGAAFRAQAKGSH